MNMETNVFMIQKNFQHKKEEEEGKEEEWD